MTQTQAQWLDWFSVLHCTVILTLTVYDAVIHRGAAMQLLLYEMQPQGFAYDLAVNVASQVSFQWHRSRGSLFHLLWIPLCKPST